MFDFFTDGKFDFKTAVITLVLTFVLIPIIVVVRKVIRNHIKEWVSYLFEGLMYRISKYVKQSMAASLSMKRYCKLQLENERLKKLYIPSRDNKSIDIDTIFVKVSIESLNEKDISYSQDNLLAMGNRILVMGDPGSGKSSLIKRMLRDICLTGRTKPRAARLPILIELKNIDTSIISDKANERTAGNVELGELFYSYIKSEVERYDVFKMDECLDNYSSAKGVVIMLDGLDEVSSSHYVDISKYINGLSEFLNIRGDNNIIILTMRTQYYQQIKDDFMANFPNSAFLKPFTPSDIYEFLTKWNFKKVESGNISRIYNDLTDRPTLREMCSNPLVLSMYVAEDENSGGSISPESRTQFYKQVTEELIIRRRSKQKTSLPSSYSSLKEQRERILGRIAYDHLTTIDEPRNTLKWSKAMSIIQSEINCKEEDAEVIFNEIAKETGLISEERYRESFRFIHLTFCEFLAAFEAVEGVEKGWEQLMMFHRQFNERNTDAQTRLVDVIPFSAGLLPRINKKQALSDIVELDETILTARCFLETKYYEHDTWSTFIEKYRDNLIVRAEVELDEKWLRDLHFFNVVVRDASLMAKTLNVRSINLSEFYKNLIDKSKVELGRILSAYADQDAAAVFRICEICDINIIHDYPELVIKHCDQIPFLGLVKERILQRDNECGWAALLVESAMQNGAINVILGNMAPEQKLRDLINNSKTNKLWYYRAYVKETFLTQCMTLIFLESCGTQNIDNMPHIQMLNKITPPSQNKYYLMFGIYSEAFVPMLLGMLIGFWVKYYEISIGRIPFLTTSMYAEVSPLKSALIWGLFFAYLSFVSVIFRRLFNRRMNRKYIIGRHLSLYAIIVGYHKQIYIGLTTELDRSKTTYNLYGRIYYFMISLFRILRGQVIASKAMKRNVAHMVENKYR